MTARPRRPTFSAGDDLYRWMGHEALEAGFPLSTMLEALAERWRVDAQLQDDVRAGAERIVEASPGTRKRR